MVQYQSVYQLDLDTRGDLWLNLDAPIPFTENQPSKTMPNAVPDEKLEPLHRYY